MHCKYTTNAFQRNQKITTVCCDFLPLMEKREIRDIAKDIIVEKKQKRKRWQNSVRKMRSKKFENIITIVI